MRLIDADALERVVQETEFDVISVDWGESDGFSAAVVFNMIADAPTIDSVTRCKECKHGHFIVPCVAAKTNHDLLIYKCGKIKGDHNPEFYCGYGVRK